MDKKLLIKKYCEALENGRAGYLLEQVCLLVQVLLIGKDYLKM